MFLIVRVDNHLILVHKEAGVEDAFLLPIRQSDSSGLCGGQADKEV
jgi:hypothetical protein